MTELTFSIVLNSYSDHSGDIKPWDGWDRTEYITPPRKKIIIETIHSTQYCCFYDHDKKFISDFSLSAGLNELTLSENVSFFYYI